MVAIPVDADAGVGESFVATVERDVVINLAFVIFCVLPSAGHAGFFVSREKKNEIAFGLDVCGIECANRGK